MTKVFNLQQIKRALDKLDPVEAIEKGFVLYSEGQVLVPPVGEMIFEDPPGDVHIKYGCIAGDDYYVVKIASGFYENPTRDLPSGNGLMLLFDRRTGQTEGILLDEGYLTDIRTAAAGAVVAKYMAPRQVTCIGVLGIGVQGRLQVRFLRDVIECSNVIAWGRSEEKLQVYRREMRSYGYRIETTLETDVITENCELIITATPARIPLLRAEQIRPGTHISAVGSDTAEKNELDPEILRKADWVVADSIDQCLTRGEIHHAVSASLLEASDVMELGKLIASPVERRDDQITVADLTGVAVQDIQIAKAVYRALSAGAESE